MLSIRSFLCHTQVTYQADQFLDKNKDYVVAEHQDLLNASSCPFVAGLFPPLPQETSKSSKFSSIGSRFKVWNSVLLCCLFVHHTLFCCLCINKISFFSSYHFQLICILGSISPFIEAICTPLHFFFALRRTFCAIVGRCYPCCCYFNPCLELFIRLWSMPYSLFNVPQYINSRYSFDIPSMAPGDILRQTIQ